MLRILPLKAFSSIPYYGSATKLVNLLTPNAPPEQHPAISLHWRQRCDLELLATGALTPLDGYMDKKAYESVCRDSRLPNGLLFPIPFVLEVPRSTTSEYLNLEDAKDGSLLATVRITDLWEPNKKLEAAAYGGDPEHPEVQRIQSLDCLYAGAQIVHCYRTQKWADFQAHRKTPAQMREYFKNNKWDRVVAFQTRNPMHYAHIELVKRAAKQNDCHILLQPVSGPTKDGDIDYVTRMKAYDAVLPSFDAKSTTLNLLPLAMRMGGPREALLHCIIRQNYGASHFIIGRDHAGPGSNSSGKDFYEPYEARDKVLQEAHNFAIKPVPFDMVVYVENDKKYYLQSEVPKGAKVMKLSGTEVRKRLRSGEEIPEWFSPAKVVSILRQKYEEDKWKEVNIALQNKTPKDIIQDAYDRFGNDVAISFSGAEDVILIEYAKQLGINMRVFCLDTGRLHPETYEFLDQVEKHYNIKLEYCFPEAQDVQNLVRQKGLFSFYKDGHTECCTVRKVGPLKKQLSQLRAWITGVRKDQSVTRTDVPYVMVDKAFEGRDKKVLVKYNPLSDMKSGDVWWDIKTFGVPYNKLHEKGFISIGCQPCTRATLPNQHEREGRWWWEEATQKECGLHKKQ